MLAHYYDYTVYGIALRSQIPLALQQRTQLGDSAEIELQTAPASFFEEAIRGAAFREGLQDWYQYARLPDRSSYVRWDGLGEFLVSSDGRRLACRMFEGALSESFQVYLVQRALSFALLKRGFEPFHATAVVVDGQAVAFIGNSGFGKSSLAACFLNQGHKLLTDDLLLILQGASGPMAYPGPARIKLFPDMARRFLGERFSGVPMNTGTKKLVLPLGVEQTCGRPVPLNAVYVLESPREMKRGRQRGIRLDALNQREAFMALVRNTFNYLHTDSERLQRQFAEASWLASAVPVKGLSHPRVVGSLPTVRDAVLADMQIGCTEALCGA